MKKNPTNSKNQPGHVEVNQQFDINTDELDCIDGDCFDIGGQKTFVRTFDIPGMGLPSNRLELWIACRLVEHSHVDINWWRNLTGSSECRPLIMSLRDKGWPIDDEWVSSPTRRLPGRYIKHWFLVPEFRIPIFQRMDAAGLLSRQRRPTARKG